MLLRIGCGVLGSLQGISRCLNSVLVCFYIYGRYYQMIAVGTAATRGIAPLRLYDLLSGAHLMDLGSDLKKGAGMLDVAWLSPSTLLSCGYDTFTRLWDTRCGATICCYY